MAIPTITLLTPNAVPPFGNIAVTILGTNFRIPDMVSQSSIWQESVRVNINGVIIAPELVRVSLDTEIEVLIPESLEAPGDYPLAVDIQIQNIDATGTPIPGEIASLVGGLTYTTIEHETEQSTGAIFRQLAYYLRRNLGVPVVGVVHVDFKTGVAVPWPDKVEEPGIYMVGPRRLTNWCATEKIRNLMDNNFKRKTLPQAYDLSYSVVGYAKHKRVLDNLMNNFEKTVRVCKGFIATFDGESVICEIEMSSPPSVAGALVNSFSSLKQFQATFIIRGVPESSELLETEYEIQYNVEVKNVIY